MRALSEAGRTSGKNHYGIHMYNSGISILGGDEVNAALSGRESEIIDTVETAYKVHAAGASSLPHSLFLRFPNVEKNRIIALPAYLGQDFDLAGLKWVSSFPDNLEKGLNRASAVIILNSSETGRPEVIMEGSIVSAKRTAASAVLAMRVLQDDRETESVGIMGCGPISFEVVRFLLAPPATVKRLVLFDVVRGRAEQFRDRCQELNGRLRVETVTEGKSLFQETQAVLIATTAIKPHIFDLSTCPPGALILHVSLRDLSPEVILASDNVVDDVDHVCRSQTSVHLAEQKVGNRDFIRCNLADVLNRVASPKQDPSLITVFSPFGLGVLDLAVGKLAHRIALEQGYGAVIERFLPGDF